MFGVCLWLINIDLYPHFWTAGQYGDTGFGCWALANVITPVVLTYYSPMKAL